MKNKNRTINYQEIKINMKKVSIKIIQQLNKEIRNNKLQKTKIRKMKWIKMILNRGL